MSHHNCLCVIIRGILQNQSALHFLKYPAMSDTKRPRVAMVCSSEDITEEEFCSHYKNRLDLAIKSGDNIILGDRTRLDTLALAYLLRKDGDLMRSRITIYAVGLKSNNDVSELVNTVYDPIGSYRCGNARRKRHIYRKKRMIENSDYRIEWSRSDKVPSNSGSKDGHTQVCNSE